MTLSDATTAGSVERIAPQTSRAGGRASQPARPGAVLGGSAHAHALANESDTAGPYDGDVEFTGPSSGVGDVALVSPQLPPQGDRVGAGAAPVHDATSFSYLSLQRSNADAAMRSDGTDSARAGIPTEAEIREWVRCAIYEPSPARTYRINPPAPGRPVRIYADGVYDLFHYAHALQLRQAKLSFPSVHLIVGVVSSELCAQHKNRPLLESHERYEAVKNCRWVDEVLEDAPWVVDQALVDRLQIDYVAHDELPYAGGQSEDIYNWLKQIGKFLPTRRTEGISTSELLARIVRVYREGGIDAKLCKMGEESLASSVGS